MLGKIFQLVAFLLVADSASAQFSALMPVTLESGASSPFNVQRTTPLGPGICTLTIDATNTGGMHAWLAHANCKLSTGEQDLRPYFWDIPSELVSDDPKRIQYPASVPFTSIIQQVPKSTYRKEADTATLAREHSEPHDEFHTVYEINLLKVAAKNTYLFVDHPKPILDGGWYYSVDLGAFCATQGS